MPHSLRYRLLIAALAVLAWDSPSWVPGTGTPQSWGAVLAGGFFSGTIERFHEEGDVPQRTFATIAPPDDPFPGIAGLAYNPVTDELLASGRIMSRIYRVDVVSGELLGFYALPPGASPAGVAVDAAGNIYVANNGGNSVTVLDTGGNPVNTIDLPDLGLGDNRPSGVGIDGSGDVYVSTFAGGGTFRYEAETGQVNPALSNPLANGLVALDAAGNLYVGGAAFSSQVLTVAAGSTTPGVFATIDADLLPVPEMPFASPDFTSPAGVAVDSAGNVFVAALGRTNPTNPADGFQQNGGLFKFAADGTLLETLGTDVTPLSSVIVLPDRLPGDANLDGVVDGRDFNIWNANKFTENSAWRSGDFDRDGLINAADYQIWRDGWLANVAGTAAVPESTVGLGGIALMLWSIWRARRGAVSGAVSVRFD